MQTSEKVHPLRDIAGILEKARAAKKRVVLAHGVFDLLHPGHVIHLKAARGFGDLLVVTVTPDAFVRKGPGQPVFPQQLRMETLSALACVDYVALNEWPTAIDTIRLLKPHVYAKGSEYAESKADITGKIVEEEAAIRSVGGELRFTDGQTFSSSSLTNRFFSGYPEQTQRYLREFRERHTPKEVLGHLERLSSLRILVVGESIVDRYTYCIPLAKPPKEFMIATRHSSQEDFAGGALATANHVAGFCREVTLATALGPETDLREFIHGHVRPNVRLRAIETPDRPTILKQRFLEPQFLTKMFEIQFLDDRPASAEPEAKFAELLESELPKHDVIVINDFGHGLITDRIRKQLCDSDRFLAINTQSNSANLGFNAVTRYARADYVCLDEAEMRLASRNKYEELHFLTTRFQREHSYPLVMVTRGQQGSLAVSGDSLITETPAVALRVVDRVGAGDAFFAITSACQYAKCPPDILGLIGNCVGALKVETVCNRSPIDPVALKKFLLHLLK